MNQGGRNEREADTFLGRQRRRHVHGVTEIKLCRASVYHLKVMIVDGGIERLLPKTYLHWLVMNVPGSKVADSHVGFVTILLPRWTRE